MINVDQIYRARNACSGLSVLLFSACFLTHITAAMALNPCKNIDKKAIKQLGLLKKTEIKVEASWFGTACFVGRKIKNPYPDSAYGIGPSGPNAPYIQFSLIKNGTVVYDFPRPPDWLWGSYDNEIISTALVKIGKNRTNTILIIGRTYESNGSDAFQPLIYEFTTSGLKFNLSLSKELAHYNIYSISKLTKKVQNNAARN